MPAHSASKTRVNSLVDALRPAMTMLQVIIQRSLV